MRQFVALSAAVLASLALGAGAAPIKHDYRLVNDDPWVGGMLWDVTATRPVDGGLLIGTQWITVAHGAGSIEARAADYAEWSLTDCDWGVSQPALASGVPAPNRPPRFFTQSPGQYEGETLACNPALAKAARGFAGLPAAIAFIDAQAKSHPKVGLFLEPVGEPPLPERTAPGPWFQVAGAPGGPMMFEGHAGEKDAAGVVTVSFYSGLPSGANVLRRVQVDCLARTLAVQSELFWRGNGTDVRRLERPSPPVAVAGRPISTAAVDFVCTPQPPAMAWNSIAEAQAFAARAQLPPVMPRSGSQSMRPQGPPGPPRGRPIANPDWVRRPSSDDFLRYYPEAAWRQGLSGRVTLSCGVNGQGLLGPCEVVEESPKGQDFAAAALRMVKIYRINPKTLDTPPAADPEEGWTVRFTLVFEPPKA